MNKKILLLILLPLVCFLQNCSWQEYFVITNQTKSNIVIEYEIEMPADGFSIFDNHPIYYKLNSDGSIYWNETHNAVDLDTANLLVKTILTPNNCLIIGELSNDNYKSHNQYFINGRHFNLKNLKIENANAITKINFQNFDAYFTKQNNLITYKIK